MKVTLLAAALLVAAPAAFASESCPDTPKDKWLAAKEIQARLEAKGFAVERLKRDGSCYEVYAKNAKGERVKAYVSPADGAIVKEKVKS